MSKIRIMADSTCDLNDELIKNYEIEVLPLYVTAGDKSYIDKVDIFGPRIFELVEEYNVLPTTSCPPVADFDAAFGEAVNAGDEVIFVSISSHLSATYQNAMLSVEQNGWQDKVFVIDTLQLSTASGVVAIKGRELAREGLTAKDIAKELIQYSTRISFSIMVDTMEYLYRGGRCTALQRLAGVMLNVRPQIEIIEGKFKVTGKHIGSKRRCIKQYYNTRLKPLLDKMNPKKVFVSHAWSEQDAIFLASLFKKDNITDKIEISAAGAVVCCHCGPGVVGVAYELKE